MKNKAKIMRNMLTGMVGAAICMTAAWLLFAYGEGNVRNGFIQSNWPKMQYIRFEIAIILFAIGVPIYAVGLRDFIKVIRMIRRRRSVLDARMAKLFEISANLSIVGMLFVFVSYAMMAIVYKQLFVTNLMGADIISVTEGMFYYMAIPVLAYFIISVGGL